MWAGFVLRVDALEGVVRSGLDQAPGGHGTVFHPFSEIRKLFRKEDSGRRKHAHVPILGAHKAQRASRELVESPGLWSWDQELRQSFARSVPFAVFECSSDAAFK